MRPRAIRRNAVHFGAATKSFLRPFASFGSRSLCRTKDPIRDGDRRKNGRNENSAPLPLLAEAATAIAAAAAATPFTAAKNFRDDSARFFRRYDGRHRRRRQNGLA